MALDQRYICTPLIKKQMITKVLSGLVKKALTAPPMFEQPSAHTLQLIFLHSSPQALHAMPGSEHMLWTP